MKSDIYTNISLLYLKLYNNNSIKRLRYGKQLLYNKE